MSILGCGSFRVKAFAAVAAAALFLPGCMSFAPLEPVISPPGIYQRDNRVMVEFVHPTMVGVRCAERGVRFLGMPGVNSGACADTQLITMANPCLTITAGWYAEVLCHELAHVNGWPHDHRGGLLFARHQPIRPASESPEALAFAAAQAGQTPEALAVSSQAVARAPDALAVSSQAVARAPEALAVSSQAVAQAPVQPAPTAIEPLALNLPSVSFGDSYRPSSLPLEISLFSPLYLLGLSGVPIALPEGPAPALTQAATPETPSREDGLRGRTV